MRADTEPSFSLEPLLAALGGFCWRRPWLICAAWLLATVGAGLWTHGRSQRLLSGSGDLSGSMSERVDRLLAAQFSTSDGQSLILIYHAPSLDAAPATHADLDETLVRRISTSPHVVSVIPAGTLLDGRLTSQADTRGVLLIGLDSADTLASEQQVPRLRAAVQPVFQARSRTHPDLEWAITGRAALTYDINIFSGADTATSEIRALPIALLILFFAFGSALAALLPLLLAMVARTLALAAIYLFAGAFDISNLAQSIVTMISLALGIDYSLFIFHRYRQLLRDQNADAALRGAMAQSGRVVLYSGVAVAIGMGALLATPSMQIRSIGLGGMCAVIMCVGVALTLLPALLSLFLHRLGPRSPQAMPQGARWARWGRMIVRRPLTAILGGLALLALLAAPAAQTRFGFPEDDFLPPQLESARGLAMLEPVGLKGLVSPMFVIVSDPGGGPLITRQRTAALSDGIGRLESDPRIALVEAPSLSPASRFLPVPVPANSGLVSKDGDRILIRILPSANTDLAALRGLAREIPAWLRQDNLLVEVGGQAQYYNDFDAEVRSSYPVILALVLVMTGAALLILLRAPLAAAKAILLNLLSVAAGYGVVVFLFQLGHGTAIFGLPGPTQFVPTSVPIIIFAILFGLSMDYEIFLISRMRAIYLQTGDNKSSIVEALADTGSVISQAALIMAAVFGAFAFSRLLIVQMIGVGLAVAITVDAVLIRSTLGPALMQVAGRLNWWPAKRADPA